MSLRSRRSVPCWVTFVLATISCLNPRPAGAAAPQQPSAPPAAPLVMRRQVLADPYAQMDAVAVLVPAGWEMKGAVNWVPGAVGGPDIDIAVLDAAQRAAVRMYPTLFFDDGVRESQKRAIMRNDPSGRNWANLEHNYREGAMMLPGIEIRQLPKSPREYVLNVLVPRLRPALAAAKDVTVVGETDMPDVAAAKAKAAVFPNTKVMCSRLRISYTGPKGPMEEEFICAIRSYPTGRPVGSETSWGAEVTSAWAPMGKLDAPLPTCNAITASRQQLLPHVNFCWQIGQMINKRWNDQLQKMIANENERIRVYGEMQRQASAQVSQEIKERFQNQQEAKAHIQENFMHYINDTSAYIDPRDGSKLTLPANYTFTYINNRGDTFQTMDPTLQPPVDPQTSWNKLEKAK